MKFWKMIALILPVTVLLATLAFVGVLESHRTPDWQIAFTQYLQTAENETPPQAIRSVWSAEAQRPDQFPVKRLLAVPTGWTWQNIEIPLPERVRCLRLELQGEADDTSTGQVVYEYLLVGYHNDGLWHVGWLVHEFRGNVGVAEQQELVAQLGCNQWEAVSPWASH